jgi:PAS domain S-box-containing protein
MRYTLPSKKLSLTLAALMIIGAFLSNLMFPHGYSLWPLFLIAVILVSWDLQWAYVYGVAAITTILALLDLIVGSPQGAFHLALINRLSTIPAIWIVAYIVIRRRRDADVLRRQIQLINLSLDAIITRHIDGTITSWSRGAERLYGWSASEALGKTTHDLLRTEFPVQFGQILDVLKREGRWEGVLIHTSREGRRLVVYSHWMLDPGTDDLLESNEDITERTRMEGEARRNEAQLEAVFQSIQDGIVVFDMNGAVLMVNESEARLNGFSSSDEMKRDLEYFSRIYELRHPDGRIVPHDDWPAARVLRGESVKDWELRSRRTDTGQGWFFSFSGEPVWDENGRQFLAVVVTRDVTDRKQAEEEIQNLARFPGENPNPILRYSPEGILLYANGSSRASLNVCLGEIGTEGPAEWRRWIAESYSSSMPFETEFTCSDRTFLMLFVPITTAGYVNIYGRDITDRKRAEYLLEEHSARTRAIVETAVDGIITIDARGLIQSVNPSVERIFGYTAEEMLGRNVNMLMPEPFFSEHDQYLSNYVTTGQKKIIGLGREVQGQRKDGTVFPLDLAVSEIVLEGQRLFTGLVRDITDRKRTENELKEAVENLSRSNSELEQFAYVASHDLQEPLRMVASYVQLLSRRYQGKLDAEADQFINFAVDGAMRMQKLIQDLLTFSRVGHRGQTFKPVDLHRIIDQAMENLHLFIQENDAKITFEHLPVVYGDESELLQLFQNLLDNALKFRSTVAPQVHLSARMDNRHWEITIKDNGIGIDAKYFDRIFLVFQRLHNKEKYSGTGIGLAICKKIVERHGGRIWVGTPDDPGATFHFTLPAWE